MLNQNKICPNRGRRYAKQVSLAANPEHRKLPITASSTRKVFLDEFQLEKQSKLEEKKINSKLRGNNLAAHCAT
ncbi:hypothetical protein KC19_3G026100 [Ceratodon purpureus]|uniref:Uncharacterized protein n=1 Tax=Ceratodon purpureus TaxID=3225 RepID=A0A8T0IGG5_CERPU|nr:hypothetical protein KC19_3G026100 [Ceratodon purpureus]